MTKHRTAQFAASLATLLAIFAPIPLARADIFQWEYINPSNPGLGKQPSTTLAPDGAGANAVPFADLSFRNLTMAYLIGADLSTASATLSDLTDAELSQANLTNVRFSAATLTAANFTGADVRGAHFDRDLYGENGGTGITAAQLYSTASYEANDLTEIHLDRNDLSNANLANQNLTRASFYGATLSNANFHQAKLTRASFTYPLGSFPLGYHVATNLSGANFSLADLTNARFGGGEECGGEFCWPFEGANLSFANLSGADARDANFHYASMGGTNTENMIQPNGHIAGLDLRSSEMLIVRNYVSLGDPVPIVVDQDLAMDATGTLRLVFDADPWDSTISFASGIPVALGGTLELTFAPDVILATQIGRTIDLFDWTCVTPTGAFTISSPFTWNLTNLYTTGEVTLTAVPSLPGDFNHDGTVDAADYVVWRKTGGTQAEFTTWRTNFGQPGGSGAGASANAAVPEPATFLLLMFGVVGWCLRRG